MNEPGRGSAKSLLPPFFPTSLFSFFVAPFLSSPWSDWQSVETGIGTMPSEYAIGPPLFVRPLFQPAPAAQDKKQTPPEIIILPG